MMALYVGFFFAALAEGPIAMTAAGFFLRLGTVELWPVYFALLCGDLAGDAAWYWIGRKYAGKVLKKYGRFLGLKEDLLQKIESAFKRHDTKILLFSKLTMGLGFALPVLLSAGAARVPFRKFMLFNAAGQVIWTGLLLGVGYSFGNFYLTVNAGFRNIALAAGIIMLALALYGYSRYVKNKKLYETL